MAVPFGWERRVAVGGGRRVPSTIDQGRANLHPPPGGVPGAGARADLPGLDRLLCHDPVRAVVEVQAGAPWNSLSALIGADFMPGTVGASVAANQPGPDGRPVIAHVQALTLATADGHLQRVRRDRSPELFSLAIGGFGVFGPFYSITLDLESLTRTAAACRPGGHGDVPETAARVT